MYLKQLEVGHMGNFEYIIADPFQRIATVIDPGWPGKDVEKTLNAAAEDGVVIKYIVATHLHHDHTGGIREMVAETGAEILVHEDELFAGATRGFDYDILVKDNDLLNLGGLSVRIIHTPGHSSGSICIHAGGKLFTGDTLFVGGCGRADLPGSNPEALYSSLYEKILSLPGDTEVYPGHDYGDTTVSTIERERQENRYLKCASLTDFLRMRMEG